MSDPTRDRWTHRAIAAGVLMPIAYYGSRLVAVPFAPHYSPVRQVASELGMAGVSRHPAVFNVSKVVGTLPTWFAALASCSGSGGWGRVPS